MSELPAYAVQIAIASVITALMIGAVAAIRHKRGIRQAAKTVAKLKRQTTAADARLQEFAYIVSHDLQEPARAVSIFSDLLKERHANELGEEAIELLEFVRRGAVQINAMIQGLLLYSRAGSEEFVLTPVALGDLVRETAAASGVAVSVVPHADRLPQITADAKLLRQVLKQLFDNARHFARLDTPAEITIRAETRSDGWQVTVDDNGVGIDSEQLERIFQPFARLSREDDTRAGMGLAVCRRIIDRHGGRIWAESSPGSGTRFVFMLPRIDDADHARDTGISQADDPKHSPGWSAAGLSPGR